MPKELSWDWFQFDKEYVSYLHSEHTQLGMLFNSRGRVGFDEACVNLIRAHCAFVLCIIAQGGPASLAVGFV